MALDADVRRLMGVRPFDALPREAAQLIAFSCDKFRLAAGDTLFMAGDTADGAFLVLEGVVALRKDGRLRRAGAGVLIGEMAMLTETTRPTDALVEADAEFLHIPRTKFRRVLAEFPDSLAIVRRSAQKRTIALIAELEEIHRRGFGDER